VKKNHTTKRHPLRQKSSILAALPLHRNRSEKGRDSLRLPLLIGFPMVPFQKKGSSYKKTCPRENNKAALWENPTDFLRNPFLTTFFNGKIRLFLCENPNCFRRVLYGFPSKEGPFCKVSRRRPSSGTAATCMHKGHSINRISYTH